MAMSLLYALLDVYDPQTLSIIESKGPQSADEARALKYKNLAKPKQMEVRAALYKALYLMLEYPEANRVQNMAIGKALCNAISGNFLGSIKTDHNIEILYEVLKPVVTETIDEIEP